MYLEVEERRERRPGVEQKMSVGRAVIRRFSFISRSLGSLSWKSWEVVRESLSCLRRGSCLSLGGVRLSLSLSS